MNLLVILAILATLNINMASSRRWSKKTILKQQSIPKASCREGNGSSYRGFVSESADGKRCLNWNMFENPWGASEGIGNHNYCRNPDQVLMPWCRVKKGRRIIREFCNIPKCSESPVKSPPAVDTEQTCGERSERKQHKIVGGSFTTIESHPWVAAIFRQRDNFLCGGSLIAPCWVVTAAHCFSDGSVTNIRRLSVYLGKSAINVTDKVNEQEFRVRQLIVHQHYNDSNYNNDIALLKIMSRDGRCAVQSASTRTVCLPPPHTQLPPDYQCSIAGFGKESYGAWHFSKVLKQANVKLIPQSKCKTKSYYGDLITDNMFCAGSPDWSIDSCEGDSGGPLVCEVSGRMFLFGVVSWGIGCAKENRPGVYTQVSNYNRWIGKKTQLFKYTAGSMYPTK